MTEAIDVVVIGGGPGGYVAAIRAAQLGLKVACVDQFVGPNGQAALGGTCLNVGCIPSKALLESSHHFETLSHDLPSHGIATAQISLDVSTMVGRKQDIVSQHNRGVAGLFAKHKIHSVLGTGSLLGREQGLWQVAVNAQLALQARHVVIATGSVPRPLPQVAIDNQRVLDNAGALSLSAVPKKLGVIGAGVIGLELGSVWRRLGSEVRLLEAMPTFLAAADEAVAREAWRQFNAQGLKIDLGVQIKAITTGKKAVTVGLTDAAGVGHKHSFDQLIVAVGRVPCTAGLGLDTIKLALDERGFIPVNHHNQCALENLWAIGDVTTGPMLAHKASEEGVMVAELIAGKAGHVDHSLIPWVIYTAPEIAWVGATEQALKAAGTAYRVGSFPFKANGRAQSMGRTEGFAKMLVEEGTDRILGVHIIGANASELIAEAVLAMAFKASAEDIARTVHAHPTLSEALHEAALATDKRALHL